MFDRDDKLILKNMKHLKNYFQIIRTINRYVNFYLLFIIFFFCNFFSLARKWLKEPDAVVFVWKERLSA